MKRIYTIVALAIATLSVSAQSLDITFTDGKVARSWENNIAIKELSKISHSVDENGNGVVSVKMKSGPTYVYGTDTIDNIASTPAEDLSAYNNGDLLSITSDMDWSVDTAFIAEVYNRTGVYAYLKTITKLLNTELKMKGGIFNPYVIHYHVYDINYVSTDIDGQKIRMSGRVIFPYSVNNNTKRSLKLSNVYLENHFTSLEESQAPTRSFYNTILTGMAAKGYLVVQPDYLGLGVTNNRSQLFIDQPVQSRNVADCLLATMHLRDLVNSDPDYTDIPLAEDATLINVGGSQGASVAVGVHRFIENNLTPEETAIMPAIKETRACSGVYNLLYTIEKYAQWDSIYFAGILPVMVEGACVGHSDLMVDDYGKAITVNDLFNPMMSTVRYPDCQNLTMFEMINSKKYDAWGLTYPLFETYGEPALKYALFSKMMASGIVVDNHLNYDHPYYNALKNVLDLSDNTTGWTPKAPVKIWAGPHDEIVPYENATMLYNNLLEENPDANITMTTLDDETLGGHTTSVAYWMLAELLGVDVNHVIEILSKLQ